LLPFSRAGEGDDEPDPIAPGAEPGAATAETGWSSTGRAGLREGARRAARRQRQAFLLARAGGTGCGRDRGGDWAARKQRQDTLLSRTAGTARPTRRALRMSPMNEPLRNSSVTRAWCSRRACRVSMPYRSRLNQARHAALEAAGAGRPAWWRGLTAHADRGRRSGRVCWWPSCCGTASLPASRRARGTARAEDMDLLADSEALGLLDGWTARSMNGRRARPTMSRAMADVHRRVPWGAGRVGARLRLARSDETRTPQPEDPDPGFLEFLGSVDRLAELNPTISPRQIRSAPRACRQGPRGARSTAPAVAERLRSEK